MFVEKIILHETLLLCTNLSKCNIFLTKNVFSFSEKWLPDTKVVSFSPTNQRQIEKRLIYCTDYAVGEKHIPLSATLSYIRILYLCR